MYNKLTLAAVGFAIALPAAATQLSDNPLPATQHQADVLEQGSAPGAQTDPAQYTAPSGQTLNGMPATPHQAEAIDANVNFSSYDKDSDGSISASEAHADANLTSQWDTLDKDNNDALDKSEFSAFEQDDAAASMPKSTDTKRQESERMSN